MRVSAAREPDLCHLATLGAGVRGKLAVPGTAKTPAIVCDAEKLSQIAIIQELGRSRIPVVAVSSDPRAAGFASRFVSLALRLRQPSYEGEYASALLKLAPRGVVFPSNDANAENLACQAELLREAGFAVYTSSIRVLEKLTNKHLLYETGAECGVRTPRSALIRTDAELESTTARFAYPLVLKPSNLAGGVYRLVKDRVLLWTEYQELRALLLTAPYRHRGAEIVVQEWIPQERSELWNISACVADGEITCMSMGRRVRTDRRRDGTIGSALLHGVSAFDEEVFALTQRLMRHVRYRGLVECEWSRRIGGGGAVLYDVNPRPSGNIRWALASGAPLVEHYYRLALGQELGGSPVMKPGVAYFKVFWTQTDFGGAVENPACSRLEALRVGFRSVWALSPLRADVVDVWDRRDLGPTLAIVKQQLATMGRTALRRFRPLVYWRSTQDDGA